MSISASTSSLIFDNKNFVKTNDDKLEMERPSLSYIQGENSARIALICGEYAAYLEGEDPEMIQKLFSALKVDMKDVAIVDLEESFVKSWKHISKELVSSEYIIVFGLNPIDLGLHTRIFKNSWFPFSGRHFIFTDRLDQMAGDKSLKLPFWNALKPIFLP